MPKSAPPRPDAPPPVAGPDARTRPAPHDPHSGAPQQPPGSGRREPVPGSPQAGRQPSVPHYPPLPTPGPPPHAASGEPPTQAMRPEQPTQAMPAPFGSTPPGPPSRPQPYPATPHTGAIPADPSLTQAIHLGRPGEAAPDTRPKRRGLLLWLIAGAVALVLIMVLLGALAFRVFGGSDADTGAQGAGDQAPAAAPSTAPAESADPTAGGDSSVVDLGDLYLPAVGDCLIGEAGRYMPIDCDEPHDAQVISTITFDTGAYPGPEVLNRDAQTGCREAYDSVVAEPLKDSAHQLKWIINTQELWEENPQARNIPCLVGPAVAGERFTGDLMPSA